MGCYCCFISFAFFFFFALSTKQREGRRTFLQKKNTKKEFVLVVYPLEKDSG